MLLPALSPGPMLVMDDPAGRQGPTVRARLARAGVAIPASPRSPDLTPVELVWNQPETTRRGPSARTTDALEDAVEAARLARELDQISGLRSRLSWDQIGPMIIKAPCDSRGPEAASAVDLRAQTSTWHLDRVESRKDRVWVRYSQPVQTQSDRKGPL